MTVIYEQQTRELEKYDLCREILTNARNELYLSMRFFDVALSSLEFLPDGNTKSWGCDGKIFHFYPDYLLQKYQENAVRINRGFLHQILHCMFGHIWNQPAGLAETEKADWNLACDIAAEYLDQQQAQHDGESDPCYGFFHAAESVIDPCQQSLFFH